MIQRGVQNRCAIASDTLVETDPVSVLYAESDRRTDTGRLGYFMVNPWQSTYTPLWAITSQSAERYRFTIPYIMSGTSLRHEISSGAVDDGQENQQGNR
jgi:hypothetical protein